MNTIHLKAALYSTGSYLREFAFKMINVTTKSKKQGDLNMNEVLFYGAADEEQSKQVGLNNLFCIYYVVLHASRSVDVCVPSLTSETMAKCLISVQQRNNVKIRVTVHHSDHSHCLQSFAQNGIEVKVNNSAVALEHEFILIDASEDYDDAVAVIGSIDYQISRVNCNNDATLLTSDITVVKALKREFDRVWYSVPDIAFKNEDNKMYLVEGRK